MLRFYIATDKAIFVIRKMLISFLCLHENLCCGYPLEAHRRGTSNKYPQHMFSWRNKKDIMWIPTLTVAMVLWPSHPMGSCRAWSLPDHMFTGQA